MLNLYRKYKKFFVAAIIAVFTTLIIVGGIFLPNQIVKNCDSILQRYDFGCLTSPDGVDFVKQSDGSAESLPVPFVDNGPKRIIINATQAVKIEASGGALICEGMICIPNSTTFIFDENQIVSIVMLPGTNMGVIKISESGGGVK